MLVNIRQMKKAVSNDQRVVNTVYGSFNVTVMNQLGNTCFQFVSKDFTLAGHFEIPTDQVKNLDEIELLQTIEIGICNNVKRIN